MRKHSKRRHPKTGEIIQDLLEGLEPKVIAYKWAVALSTIFDIKHKFIGVVRFIKPQRDANQYELDL